MTLVAESSVKEFTIELLEKSGYQYVYAPDITPDSDTRERNRFEEVLLSERLQSAVCRVTQNKVETIDATDDQRINSKQIRTLEKLRDTLLPKLMGGEVRAKLEQ